MGKKTLKNPPASKKTLSEKDAMHNPAACLSSVRAVRDAIELLNGKWKLPIIVSLTFGTKRFGEISKEIGGITDRMLSKELRDLELNQLITRTVYDTFPPTVEYSITEHGRSLRQVIASLGEWGHKHRKVIVQRPK